MKLPSRNIIMLCRMQTKARILCMLKVDNREKGTVYGSAGFILSNAEGLTTGPGDRQEGLEV